MKICVVYATAGAGHRKAAEALYDGLKAHTTFDIVLIDALDYTSKFYKYMYSQSYTFLISKIPWLWAFFFALLDIPVLLPLVRFFRRIHNGINAQVLSDYFIRENFDVIFSTHFFPNEVAAYLKRKGKIKSKIICSITDFDVHSIWVLPGIDCYTVATDWTKEKICKFGIDARTVFPYGIPTHEKFSLIRDIPQLKQKLGLKEDVFTVLIATGSFGIGPIGEIIDRLRNIQVMVVCGHNKNLFDSLKQRQKELVKIHGLVNNMDELMAVSDAMITKPGGLSISEALVNGLPLVFFNAIPGQETNNIKVLKSYGVGISGFPMEEIAQILNQFQSSPEEYRKAQEKAKAIAKPSAVRDIITLLKYKL